jgi:hypothetical protein
MRRDPEFAPKALRLLLGGSRARTPRGRVLYLSDEIRMRGGKKSKRRTARVWKPAR